MMRKGFQSTRSSFMSVFSGLSEPTHEPAVLFVVELRLLAARDVRLDEIVLALRVLRHGPRPCVGLELLQHQLLGIKRRHAGAPSMRRTAGG
ncbi:hypothetical protein PCAR4_40174 [Paraburkholderia caribensis]|nr:hypothetical protein PCAR4_40174 [Paraburkholderia caribensis]